ncbi:hypothetical protein [Streptomyces griseorubiginosus]|nr:hypothetical protein [Streptomyces griseorubiginosus]WUB41814.1 hypothetical protein OHN19_00110 [Streptomyces griseorubiginosus]WUB50334.1 hypothetical protein OG942_00105 [Streptomyces griseorubiginosus]
MAAWRLATLLDDALAPGVRAAYLVEGVVDPEAFAHGLGRALAWLG